MKGKFFHLFSYLNFLQIYSSLSFLGKSEEISYKVLKITAAQKCFSITLENWSVLARKTNLSENHNFCWKRPVFLQWETNKLVRVSEKLQKPQSLVGFESTTCGLPNCGAAFTYELFRTPTILQTRNLRVLGEIRRRKKTPTNAVKKLISKEKLGKVFVFLPIVLPKDVYLFNIFCKINKLLVFFSKSENYWFVSFTSGSWQFLWQSSPLLQNFWNLSEKFCL